MPSCPDERDMTPGELREYDESRADLGEVATAILDDLVNNRVTPKVAGIKWLEANGPVKWALVCPYCGGESAYIESTLYWVRETQKWTLSDTTEPEDGDTIYCGDCGKEAPLQEWREVIK